MSAEDICRNIFGVIAWVHSEGVCEVVPLQECVDAGNKPLGLIWVDTAKSVDLAHEKIRSRLCARKLFSGMPPLEAVKVLVSIMMSVCAGSNGKKT